MRRQDVDEADFENSGCSPVLSPSTIKLTLPFPPSVNGLFGGGSGQKRFPSKKYKDWLKLCATKADIYGIAVNFAPISQAITITYTFSWPDKRVRDGQNYMKAVTDWLVNQGVIEDDNYNIIVSESWNHVGVDKLRPRVEVEIKYV